MVPDPESDSPAPFSAEIAVSESWCRQLDPETRPFPLALGNRLPAAAAGIPADTQALEAAAVRIRQTVLGAMFMQT